MTQDMFSLFEQGLLYLETLLVDFGAVSLSRPLWFLRKINRENKIFSSNTYFSFYVDLQSVLRNLRLQSCLWVPIRRNVNTSQYINRGANLPFSSLITPSRPQTWLRKNLGVIPNRRFSSSSIPVMAESKTSCTLLPKCKYQHIQNKNENKPWACAVRTVKCSLYRNIHRNLLATETVEAWRRTS